MFTLSYSTSSILKPKAKREFTLCTARSGIRLIILDSLEEIEAVFGDKLAETIEEAGERTRKEKAEVDAEHKEVSA